MDVKYSENVRFFKAALFSLEDLDGIMYKHELCLGPMSINDLDNDQYKRMVAYLGQLRGAYSRYESAYKKLCDKLDVKPTLPDNSTRLPIAFMKTCNWIESYRTKDLYPPKSLECIRLTDHGKEVAKSLHNVKDLRLDEYEVYSEDKQRSLIRLGTYSMLYRSGYNLSPVKGVLDKDSQNCKDILEGKPLLFSPYQTLHHEIVDDALSIKRTISGSHSSTTILPEVNRTDTLIHDIKLNKVNDVTVSDQDSEIAGFRNLVEELKNNGLSKEKIINKIFSDCISDTQTKFYPFIAMLFRVMGFDCQASRPGDNGARWDAIIVDKNESIPIEIKSPTEEQHLSLKAIRQALENKVILLSRETHPTLPETTSLAVGYYNPNDRAEVMNLMNDFKNAYGYSIGVLDLKTILTIAVTIILESKMFDVEKFNRLEGFGNATFE